MSERMIDTGLKTDLDMASLDAVLGQLSDGMWENSPMMDKYWPYIEIEKRGGKVYLDISDSYRKYDYPRNGFMDMDDATIKTWLAKKLKAVIKEEGLDWKRDNTETTDYLSTDWRLPSKEEATVADCYYVYEVLRGRNVAKHIEYRKKMGLDEALDILKSAGKLITEGYVDLFGVLKVDRDTHTRNQIRKINNAKQHIERFLNAKDWTDIADEEYGPDYYMHDLKLYGAFDDSDITPEEFYDKIGVSKKRSEFNKQEEEFKVKIDERKAELVQELADGADMKILEHPGKNNYSIVGLGPVLAFKDIDPELVRFEVQVSSGNSKKGILPRLRGLYQGGWCNLQYETLGHSEDAPKIPNWTVEGSNSFNWPMKADPETLKEIHDFLKSNWKYVEDAIRDEHKKQDDISRDLHNYKGSNWSGD
jgi:hypothetical protein